MCRRKANRLHLRMGDKRKYLRQALDMKETQKWRLSIWKIKEFFFHHKLFSRWLTAVITGPEIHQVKNQYGSNGRFPNIIRMSSMKLLKPKAKK